MVDLDGVIHMAVSAGFSAAAKLDCGTIRLRPEVREMCSADKCHSFAKNWTCPPACGSLEECAEKVSRYKSGIIVQTVGKLEDEFDFESMNALIVKNNSLFAEFAEVLAGQYPSVLPLGSGACRVCGKCTYPDNPCRFPGKSYSSMEAYGMLVSEVCAANNLPYYYGSGTMVYTGCYLIE